MKTIHSSSMTAFVAAITFTFLVCSGFTEGKLTETTEKNCEVCVRFLGKFAEELSSDDKSDPKKIEAAFRTACSSAIKKDKSFCYYIGGLEDSATGILTEMSKPISWGMPASKVCLKLYKKDQQICDLRYEKEIDLSEANLTKMKVKDLKKILNDWDEQCRGCTEKSEYVRLIEELMPKHAPESHAKRQQKAEL